MDSPPIKEIKAVKDYYGGSYYGPARNTVEELLLKINEMIGCINNLQEELNTLRGRV